MTDIFKLIKHQEGLRLKLYKCTSDKWSIGWGRNLEDVGISEEEADFMLRNDISRCMYEVRGNIPVFDELDTTRQNVLISMCYNMGIVKLLGFKKMLKALERHDYIEAKKQMLDSQWARQVPNRANELALMMEKGDNYPWVNY